MIRPIIAGYLQERLDKTIQRFKLHLWYENGQKHEDEGQAAYNLSPTTCKSNYFDEDLFLTFSTCNNL